MTVSDSQELPSSWREFLGQLDEALSEPVELHCIGGFVISLLYGLPRPTGDVDYISANESCGPASWHDKAGMTVP
jgi:hypothetical protein